MAKKSEIKVKRLISLFEPTTEIQSEEIQRRGKPYFSHKVILLYLMP